jgi:hypothetical protein
MSVTFSGFIYSAPSTGIRVPLCSAAISLLCRVVAVPLLLDLFGCIARVLES